MLLIVISALFAYILPLPFLFLEILVAFVQVPTMVQLLPIDVRFLKQKLEEVGGKKRSSTPDL